MYLFRRKKEYQDSGKEENNVNISINSYTSLLRQDDHDHHIHLHHRLSPLDLFSSVFF